MNNCSNCSISVQNLKQRTCISCNDSFCVPCCPFLIPTSCSGTCVVKIAKNVLRNAPKNPDGTILIFNKKKTPAPSVCNCMENVKHWRVGLLSKFSGDQLKSYYMCHLCCVLDFISLSDYELVKFLLQKCGYETVEQARQNALQFKRNNLAITKQYTSVDQKIIKEDLNVVSEVKNILNSSEFDESEE